MVKDQPEQSKINSMQNLLQVAVQNQQPGIASGEEQRSFEQMSGERREFLESAIRDITVDHVEVLRKQIQKLNDLIVKLNSKSPLSEEENDEYCQLLEEDLVENVSNIDFANDFYKLGGFQSLTELIDCELATFKVPTMNLIAELVQNNDYCQKAAYELNYLSKFNQLIKNERNQSIVLKTVYALSCLLRGNEQILEDFLRRDSNVRTLLNAMLNFSSNEKIVFKISFLINSICGLKPDLYDTLARLDFVHLAINLMKKNLERTHEYLLAILVGLAENSEQAKNDCLKGDLKSIVQDKIKLLADKDEFLEEVAYCKGLVDLLN